MQELLGVEEDLEDGELEEEVKDGELEEDLEQEEDLE